MFSEQKMISKSYFLRTLFFAFYIAIASGVPSGGGKKECTHESDLWEEPGQSDGNPNNGDTRNRTRGTALSVGDIVFVGRLVQGWRQILTKAGPVSSSEFERGWVLDSDLRTARRRLISMAKMIEGSPSN